MGDDEFIGAIEKSGPHQSLFHCNKRFTNFQQNSPCLGSVAEPKHGESVTVRGSSC